MRFFILLLVIFGCCVTVDSAAQVQLDSMANSYQAWRSTTLQEKVFLHTDRTSYLTGETLWLKAYRVDAASHHAIDWSQIVYVELLDRNSLPVLQTKFLLNKKGGEGSVFLPASLGSGNYVLRAYTNWMKNSGAAFFFHQAITVINPFVPLEPSSDTTSAKYDAQFFPEGGDLVNGLESIVGVRVVAKNGHGIDFKGAVLNDQHDTVARFNSSQFGLGKFKFRPEANRVYHAVIIDNRKKVFHFPLPQAKTNGYVLHVNDASADQLALTITGKDVQADEVYLLVHTRQMLKVQQRVSMRNGVAAVYVDRKLLGEGVSILTVFDQQLNPVCERLYFIRPQHKLSIGITGNPYLIRTREKVKLDITLGALNDSISDASMSLAVYKIDSLDLPAQSIADYLWLTSDLSGTVENPGYYFGTETLELRNDTDNLMLTQGWRRFDWKSIRNRNNNYSYPPEINGHLVSGKITDITTDKPADRVDAYLSFMGTPVNVYVSESREGRILFETEPIVGNKSMIVQTVSAAGEKYRIEIEDPFFDKGSISCPPFQLTRKQSLALEQRSIHMQVQNLFYENNTATKPNSAIKTFYGKPDETYQLDDYTRFPTLEEVMREYVPGIRVKKRKEGFHLSNIDLVNKTAFSSDPLALVDGVPVFDINKLMEIDPLKLKQLDVIKKRYYLNAVAFDGIVSYTSYRGDLAGYQPPEHALLMNYKGLETRREFFTPRYDVDKSLETQPDARRVLFWSSGNLPRSGNHYVAEFFTSDIAGEYRIVIQALTTDGLPGYYTTSFLVK